MSGEFDFTGSHSPVRRHILEIIGYVTNKLVGFGPYEQRSQN